jgi:uncharacterized membrane protein YjdF
MMKKEGVMKLFIYLSWLLIAAGAVIDLFHHILGSIGWALLLALLVILYFKLKVPSYLHLLFSFIAILAILGETIGLYYLLPYYDKILHLINPLTLCIIIYCLAKDKIKDKKLLMLFCVFATLSLTVGWEIIEYGFDSLFKGTSQGVYLMLEDGIHLSYKTVVSAIDDTMMDFIFNVIGTGIFALVFWLKNIKNKGKRKARKHS